MGDELLIAGILPHHNIMRWKQLTRISIIRRQAAAAWVFMKQTQSVQSCRKVLLNGGIHHHEILSVDLAGIGLQYLRWVHVYQSSCRYPSKLLLLNVSQLMTAKRQKRNNNPLRLQTFWQNAKSLFVSSHSSFVADQFCYPSSASPWNKLDFFLQ